MTTPRSKLRIGVLFGGRSGEHEVSLLSAASILQALDPAKYDIVPIGITKAGHWVTGPAAQQLLGTPLPKHLARPTPKSPAPKPPRNPIPKTLAQATLPLPADTSPLDLIFPVLHGTFGEDGTIQGLLELADIPFVGSGTLGSAAGMDKIVMKQIFAALDLPQTPFLAVLRAHWHADPKHITRRIEKHLRYPLFIKPANLGSSVGISKVHDRSELAAAMDLASSFDRKLIVEQGVGGPGVKPRELEVAVLGNDSPDASVVGEIVPGAEFYDYNAKYLSNTSVPHIPADLPKHISKRIRKMAIAAFQACDCAGLARVDFLLAPPRKHPKKKHKHADAEASLQPPPPLAPKLSPDHKRAPGHKPDPDPTHPGPHATHPDPHDKPAKHDKHDKPGKHHGKKKHGKHTDESDWEIVLNEINTLPGFTSISMYPKLWEASGLPYPDLLDRLITLALARHQDRTATHFSRE